MSPELTRMMKDERGDPSRREEEALILDSIGFV
jgi:hypothetical protein